MAHPNYNLPQKNPEGKGKPSLPQKKKPVDWNQLLKQFGQLASTYSGTYDTVGDRSAAMNNLGGRWSDDEYRDSEAAKAEVLRQLEIEQAEIELEQYRKNAAWTPTPRVSTGTPQGGSDSFVAQQDPNAFEDSLPDYVEPIIGMDGGRRNMPYTTMPYNPENAVAPTTMPYNPENAVAPTLMQQEPSTPAIDEAIAYYTDMYQTHPDFATRQGAMDRIVELRKEKRAVAQEALKNSPDHLSNWSANKKKGHEVFPNNKEAARKYSKALDDKADNAMIEQALYAADNDVPKARRIVAGKLAGSGGFEITGYDSEGRPLIKIGGSGMTTKTEGTLQEKQRVGLQLLSDLVKIGDRYSEAYLTYRGKWRDWTGNIMSKAEISDKEMDDFTGGRKKFVMAVEAMFNQYRKEITGAAASHAELERLKETMLNTDMSPSQFNAAYADMVAIMRSQMELNNRLAGSKLADNQLEVLLNQELDRVMNLESTPDASEASQTIDFSNMSEEELLE